MLRLLAVLALLVPVAAPAQTLDKIRKSGVITLGYIDGAAPFSFTDGNGEPQGYSVELCRAVAEGVAAQLKRTGMKTRWVKLTIQNRIDAVRKKQVDLECSTTTWTLSRQQLVDFSLVTFLDGGGLLVGAQSDANRLQDLGGKRIAVIRGTTTEKALRAALGRYDVKAEVVTVEKRDEGLALLREAQVEAFAADRTTLIGVVVMSRSGPGNFRLLDEDFSIEQYALMLPRGDHDWRLAVNRQLARVYRSGQIQDIYARWLGPLGPPSMLLSATYFIQTISE
ncbi:MAG TPA: amino acid ABC transporter substrate-binding protein [Burkholderiales bacterium]|nr:amino acid ABC transporter substrate-binding protein [Burkholderiales bacterium]